MMMMIIVIVCVCVCDCDCDCDSDSDCDGTYLQYCCCLMFVKSFMDQRKNEDDIVLFYSKYFVSSSRTACLPVGTVEIIILSHLFVIYLVVITIIHRFHISIHIFIFVFV